MIVKNILINNFDIYIDLLVRELINLGINYTLIENEIHFDNYIIRFYEIKDSKEIVDLMNFRDFIESSCIDIKEYIKANINLKNSYLKLDTSFKNETLADNKYKVNKRKIHDQNKLINKKINTKGYR